MVVIDTDQSVAIASIRGVEISLAGANNSVPTQQKNKCFLLIKCTVNRE